MALAEATPGQRGVSVVATDLTAHGIHHVVAHFGDESLLRLPMSGWMNFRMADFKVPISVDGVCTKPLRGSVIL